MNAQNKNMIKDKIEKTNVDFVFLLPEAYGKQLQLNKNMVETEQKSRWNKCTVNYERNNIKIVKMISVIFAINFIVFSMKGNIKTPETILIK